VLRRLRELFGKERLSEDDAIRLQSIRQNVEFRQATGAASAPETFLQQASATVTFDYATSPQDTRVLELVNKTNQFNLNGIRFTESEWHAAMTVPGSVLAAVSYQDKYGPLGKIAVFRGTIDGDVLHVNVWVMSCRAFARRIEHQCVRNMFDRFGVSRIALRFLPTERNGPLQDFLSAAAESRPSGTTLLTRAQFEKTCPPLYHTVRETTKAAEANG